MKYAGSAVLLLLVLTACGGSGSSGSDGSPSGAASAATAGTSAPSASSTSSTTAAGKATTADKNPVDGTAFCAFLTKEAPRLTSDGSAPGAEADFAIELANWIGEHPDQKPRTAADLDAAAQADCPKERAIAVSAMGAGSFDDALG